MLSIMSNPFYIVPRPASRPGTWRVWGSRTLLPGDSNDFPLDPGIQWGRKTFDSYAEALAHAERVGRSHPDWTVVK